MIVKFCGFKTESDIKKIKKLEVDAVGFIHYPDSKRHVSLKQLKYLAKIVPDHIEKVVVVVNPQMSTIKRIINQTDINTIQLHGNESIQLIRNIKKLNSKIRIIKAIPATRNLNNNIQKYKDEIDMFIIDTPSITYGGTGQSFDWKLLKKIKRLEIYSFGQCGYDISTGIESYNEKDFNKMTRILKFLKGDE